MRTTLAWACALALATGTLESACTERQAADGNDVDLDAAAVMAEQDIANYAAARRLARHRHAASSPVPTSAPP